MRIPEALVEQIAAANDIVDVIGGYIVLRRDGAIYRCHCPFHMENTASFTVDPRRQVFRCLECGAGGGVFRFVMSMENLEFIPAVMKLAERAGIRIAL